jgi:hypothetical protein
MNEELQDLKKEADDLGLTYNAQIGVAKLQEKIDAYYESQETSEKELIAAVKAKEEAVKADEQPEEKAVQTSKTPVHGANKRAARRKAAEATRVVTIIDNDQRVNNITTTCTVSCSNMYFDLGTIILPLNMAVEVKQGHLNVLKELKIPQHVKDAKSGLSQVRMVPRYTISYEQN